MGTKLREACQTLWLPVLGLAVTNGLTKDGAVGASSVEPLTPIPSLSHPSPAVTIKERFP